MSKKRAMDGVAASRSVHEEAWTKLGKVIARKARLSRGTTKETSLRARAARKITFYNRLLLELETASAVVGAPTTAEIAEVKRLVTTVKNVAVADAMRRAGLDVITNALDRSRDVVAGTKKG